MFHFELWKSEVNSISRGSSLREIASEFGITEKLYDESDALDAT